MNRMTTRQSTKITQEKRVAEFLHKLPSMRAKQTPAAKPWEPVVGTAKGDAVDVAAAKLGAEWRAKMNQSKFG